MGQNGLVSRRVNKTLALSGPYVAGRFPWGMDDVSVPYMENGLSDLAERGHAKVRRVLIHD